MKLSYFTKNIANLSQLNAVKLSISALTGPSWKAQQWTALNDKGLDGNPDPSRKKLAKLE